MARAADAKRIFISCVSDEFERGEGDYFGLRSDLAKRFRQAGCGVKVQEDFRQVPVDTLEKLDEYIQQCDAVIHIVGEHTGSVDASAVEAYLKKTPNFLHAFPGTREKLGDFSDLTYTQWEAFLALHHGKELYVYRTPTAAKTPEQATHLDRLKGTGGRHATEFEKRADFFGHLIGDLHQIIALRRPSKPKIASSRIQKHSPPKLFGRDKQLADLDGAWNDGAINVYSLIAWGGVGKTSLVAHWVRRRFIERGWPGVERYFDWSFYSQGTGDQRQTSSDQFIDAALRFFGDPDLIAQHRTLLVLDGVEPLQYPITDPVQAGRFKDQGLQSLLLGLAQRNAGLCIVTSRETLTDLQTYDDVSSPQKKLNKLLKEAAVALLRHLQVVGTEAEMEAAWKDAGGHALTLQLLGRYIVDAFPDDPNIRRRDVIDWHEADEEEAGEVGRSTFKVMLAYERWFESGDLERRGELDLLRLTGLFDRPITPDCLGALLAEPPIDGLTDRLVQLSSPSRNHAIRRLLKIGLLSQEQPEPDATFGDDSEADETKPIKYDPSLPLDAHPLVREYFARQLRDEKPEAFRAAHSRLFDHLCETTKPHRPDGLDGLAPLYQAIAHGCLAGRHQEACDGVYVDRILRGTRNDGFYAAKVLGAIGANLSAVAAFFDRPWKKISSRVVQKNQAWLIGEASYYLQNLGRLTEAMQPMRIALDMLVSDEDWENAAVVASNLSELEVTLGRLQDAVNDAHQSLQFADRSDDGFQRMGKRSTVADALHQVGKHAEAIEMFEEAEVIQRQQQPEYGLLYSLPGFRFSEAILSATERTAWWAWINGSIAREDSTEDCDTIPTFDYSAANGSIAAGMREAEGRAAQTLEWVQKVGWLFHMALDHLTLGRVCLYSQCIFHQEDSASKAHLAAAVRGLREAGRIDYLPKALRTAAWQAHLDGDPDKAEDHLREAQGIAERGPMPLYLAEVHLHRARLFRNRDELAKARELIEKHGYGRRHGELADAEAAAAHWP